VSLLDNFPHTCSAYPVVRTNDDLGGAKDSYGTAVFTGRACWLQQAGDNEVTRFQKKGIDVTGKIYFTVDPGLTTKHDVVVLDKAGNALGTWTVKSRPRPDASAGLGVLFRVMVDQSTTGSSS